MKTNYVLIDYENVQPSTLIPLDQEYFKVIVFVGSNQTKIMFEVAWALQEMGARAKYVKISGSGTNALDFHIAFYIGQLAVQEPHACFHIISKDTGFDPLIQHLKSKKIVTYRWLDVPDIPVVKLAQATSPTEKLSLIVANLRLYKAAKPRTIKTLSSTISTLFQNKLSQEELSSLVRELQKQGIVTVQDTKVTYALPA